MYVTRVQEPDGRSTSTEYYLVDNKNKYGDIKSVTDRNGNKTSYEIDDKGNITKITNPDATYKEYWFDEKNNLVKEKDESGYLKFYVYDQDQLNLIKEVKPLNKTDEHIEGTSSPDNFAITEFVYYTQAESQNLFNCNVTGLLKTEEDPMGNMTEYTYDIDGNIKTLKNPMGHITQNGYDRAGRKVYTITPKNYRTDYTYDNNGQLVKKVLHQGETTRIIYDKTGKKIQVVEPKQYDSNLDVNGSYTQVDHGYRYTYFTHGRIETVTDPENNVTSYTYDVFGNQLSETKPNGSVYEYEYDDLNRNTKVYFKENAEDTQILLEEYSYDVLSGGKTQITKTAYFSDTEKALTVSIYDYAERLIEKQNPDGTITKTSYNPNGTVGSITHENGSSTYYTYDELNRVLGVWEPLEKSGGMTRYSYTEYGYDKAGRKTEEKNGKSTVALYIKPSSFITKTYSYNENGHVISIVDNEGRKTVYEYDGDGNLSKEERFTDSSNKITTEYVYNYLNKQTEIKQHVKKGDIYGNSFGSTQNFILTTTYTYDKNGNKETVTTPDNVTSTYTYDNLNRQLSGSIPNQDEHGNTVQIMTSATYDWQGNPLTETDAKGHTTTYDYDRRGFLVKIIDADQGISVFKYDRAGRKIIEVSPENYDSEKTLEQMARTEYVYDTMGRIKAKILKYHEKKLDPATYEWTSSWVEYVSKAFKYDNSGNMIKELDALGYQAGYGTTIDNRINSGYGTEYTYNLANMMVTNRDAETNEKALPYTMKYEYDGLGRTVSETKANGVITQYRYDDGGNVISVEVKKTSSSSAKTISTSTYDLAGRKITETDGNGNTVTYEYNDLNKLRKVIYPGDSSIASNTITYQYDTKGNPRKQLDSLDGVELFGYDNLNRVLSHTRQKDGGTQSITNTASYDKNGNKRFETDGEGNTTEYVYDVLNRVVESKMTVKGILKTNTFTYDKNGNQLTTTDWRDNTFTNIYDALGRVLEKQDPYTTIQKLEYNRNNVQIKSWDALNQKTEYIYDKNDRLLTTIAPKGQVTRQSYDKVGNIATKTDGNNNITKFVHDEFNRLKSVTNAKNEMTSYTYDLNGNMLTQIDAIGHVTTYEYNVMNLPVKRIDHGGRTGSVDDYEYISTKVESYTYYANGKLKTKVDRNGETTTYTYDVHKRLLSQAIGSDAITYTYDKNGNQLTMTDSTGTTTRTYDEQNRALTKEVPYIGIMTFEYDIISSVPAGFTAEKYTDPKGNKSTKVFDKAGRLIEVITNGNTTSYEYYANGSKKSIIYPNGAREDYTYYDDGLLKTLVNKNNDGSVIDSYSYTYDNANNQTSKTDAKGTTHYEYDCLNRLEKVTEPNEKVTAYTFDKAGNRFTQSVSTDDNTVVTLYEYNEQNRLMTTITQDGAFIEKITYAYDANGNTISKSKLKTKPLDTEAVETIFIYKVGDSSNTDVSFYEYNVWNQLIKTKEGDKIAEYGYNGEGLRTEKSVNGEITRYLYEYDKVILEVDGSGNEKATNLYGTNLISREVDGTTLYYMYNGHADVTALINPSGDIVSTYYYDAFGVPIETTGNADNPIRYAGYQYDEESGLYYLNARYYDAVTARFLTEDTYRGKGNDPLSLNLYTYCHNNPVRYTDPTGHGIWDSIKKIGKKINRYINRSKSGNSSSDSNKSKDNSDTSNGNTDSSNKTNSIYNTFASIGKMISRQISSTLVFKPMHSKGSDDIEDIAGSDFSELDGLIAYNSVAFSNNGFPVDMLEIENGEPKFVSITDFAGGAWEGYVEFSDGLYNIVMHPVDTYVNLSEAMAHPINTTKRIYDSVQTTINTDIINGDVYSNSRVSGRLSFDILTMMIGGKSLDTLNKADDISDVGTVANLVKETSETSKWIDDAGNIIWPKNDGFAGIADDITLKPGTRIDRYGSSTGSFVSPQGTPYKMRSLAPGSQNKAYKVYEVIEPIKVKAGEIAPWFDQPGGGMQYKFDQSIKSLLDSKIIREVK